MTRNISWRTDRDPGTMNRNIHIWAWVFIIVDISSLCSILWTVEHLDYFFEKVFFVSLLLASWLNRFRKPVNNTKCHNLIQSDTSCKSVAGWRKMYSSPLKSYLLVLLVGENVNLQNKFLHNLLHICHYIQINKNYFSVQYLSNNSSVKLTETSYNHVYKHPY